MKEITIYSKTTKYFWKVIGEKSNVENCWAFRDIPKMDGWMTCDFTSFSTVFQSYQDDGSGQRPAVLVACMA